MTNKDRALVLARIGDDIERMYDGELKEFGITPYMVRDIERVYDSLWDGRSQATLCDEVKDYFINKGLSYKPYGAGYLIYFT